MNHKIYYNDNNPFVVQWLRNLIDAGALPDGRVDDKDIKDVKATDIVGYTRLHFFAGIGGWELALQLAGWPEDRPVWTGSCPCQPFSHAGRKTGFEDHRHLWPVWFALIRECRPPVIFGEQVASHLGYQWLDAVLSDLESEGYAVGAADLPAMCVGAPHIRQRLWFVALGENALRIRPRRRIHGNPGIMSREIQAERLCKAMWMANAKPEHYWAGKPRKTGRSESTDSSNDNLLSDTTGLRFNKRRPGQKVALQRNCSKRGGEQEKCEHHRELSRNLEGFCPSFHEWDEFEWLPCSDGKLRPTKPGLFPLAHGLPRNVGQVQPWLEGMGDVAEFHGGLAAAKRNLTGRLSAYGNAIVPQVAAIFVRAVMDYINDAL